MIGWINYLFYKFKVLNVCTNSWFYNNCRIKFNSVEWFLKFFRTLQNSLF